jgi:hypothetical protein
MAFTDWVGGMVGRLSNNRFTLIPSGMADFCLLLSLNSHSTRQPPVVHERRLSFKAE